jgi:hypothetical protein
LVINACSDTGCGGLEVEGTVVGRGEGVEGVDGGNGEDVEVLGVGVGAGVEVGDVQATTADRPNATSPAHHTPRRPPIEQYCALAPTAVADS